MAENKLTDKHLRNVRPGGSERTIGDGGGLWIRVLSAKKGGAVSFYYRFLIDGKERRFNCGSYPETSLAEAPRKSPAEVALAGGPKSLRSTSAFSEANLRRSRPSRRQLTL